MRVCASIHTQTQDKDYKYTTQNTIIYSIFKVKKKKKKVTEIGNKVTKNILLQLKCTLLLKLTFHIAEQKGYHLLTSVIIYSIGTLFLTGQFIN